MLVPPCLFVRILMTWSWVTFSSGKVTAVPLTVVTLSWWVLSHLLFLSPRFSGSPAQNESHEHSLGALRDILPSLPRRKTWTSILLLGSQRLRQIGSIKDSLCTVFQPAERAIADTLHIRFGASRKMFFPNHFPQTIDLVFYFLNRDLGLCLPALDALVMLRYLKLTSL